MNTTSGEEFSKDGMNRFILWRLWDLNKPRCMFVGLNPSKAGSLKDDPTIKSVCRIAKSNGFGGVYMVNCFPHISTNPQDMKMVSESDDLLNREYIFRAWCRSEVVVFAWGNFQVVKDSGILDFLTKKFPDAKAIAINKNGSPKHPLYCKSDSKLIDFNN